MFLGFAAPAAAQTIDSSEITEGETKTFTISGIPSSWTGTVQTEFSGSAVPVPCLIASSFPNWDVCETVNQRNYDSTDRVFTFEIQARADSVDDPDETFDLVIRDGADSSRTATFTITIKEPPATISASLPDQEGVSRVDGKQPHEESVGSVVFDLSANKPLPSNLTVCVRVSEQGGNRVASGNEGIQTATLLASGTSNGSGSYTVNWTDTAADDPDSTVIVRVVPPEGGLHGGDRRQLRGIH